MSTVPNLLNDDQTASIATALMMSHHGFRRDLARFETALEKVAEGDGSSIEAFPPPPDDDAAAMYAQGFAWAMHGIAPDVLEKVYAMLPEVLIVRLPAARAAFDARCERVWGSVQPGAARTPIPDSAHSSITRRATGERAIPGSRPLGAPTT